MPTARCCEYESYSEMLRVCESYSEMLRVCESYSEMLRV